MKPKLIKLQRIGNDDIGFIYVLDNISFKCIRSYFIKSTPAEIIRGNHAHKSLSQILIALNGKVNITLTNQKGEVFNHKLDNPQTGLYIPPMFWRVISFSKNAILLCHADQPYSENDYIRDFKEFKNYRL